MDFTKIFELLIGLLAAAVTGILLPILKNGLDAEKYQKMLRYVSVGTQAAEQLIGPGKGKEKLAYVENYLADRNITFDRAAVEAAVLENFGHGSQINRELLSDIAEDFNREMTTEFTDGGQG